MLRKVYAAVMLLIVFSLVVVLAQRHQVEDANRQIALFMDGTDLLYRSKLQQLDLAKYLSELKNAGLYGVASHVVPLHELETIGELVLKRAGIDAADYAQTLGLPAPRPTESILDVRNGALREPLLSLVRSLSPEVTIYDSVVYTNLPFEQLWRASLGFSAELVAAVEKADLAFMPVFSPYTGSSAGVFASMLQTGDYAGVMFTGNRLAADLSGLDQLEETLYTRALTFYWLQRSDTLRGYVPLEGVEELLSAQSRVVRTYRISRAETDNPEVTPANMISRWLGSIKEYNTRAIYMRPFYREQEIAYNSQYVSSLVNALANAGYTVGAAEPFTRFYPNHFLQLFIGLGLGLLAYVMALRFRAPKLLAAIGLAGIIVLQVALWTEWSLWLRLGLALGGAILASFTGIALNAEGKRPFVAYVWVQLSTVSLALLTVAYISDYDFIAEFEFFRGVKLQYTLPLLLLAFLLWLPRWRHIAPEVVVEIKRLGLWLTMAAVLAGGALLFLYIRRSGHVHAVSQWELQLRFWLDETLVVRPRFKELIAHPLLLIVLYYRRRLPKLLYEAGLILACIGQVSIVNTFMHVRTPLALSLLRTFHGLWMGTLLGLISLALVQATESGWRIAVRRGRP